MKETLWVATYLIWKQGEGMRVLHLFTYCDTLQAADNIMSSFTLRNRSVRHTILDTIRPLDTRYRFKDNAAIYEAARVLANVGYDYIHADSSRPSALFELRKILLPT